MKDLFVLLAVSLLLTGCGATKTVYVDKAADKGDPVLSLDYRDFDTAIKEMVVSLLESGVLKKDDGGKYVMVTGHIMNDTTQNIDTRQLMSSVEEQLINSGQVRITSAIGDSWDEMVYTTRDQREGGEFKQETLPGKSALIAPELSFSGQVFERVVHYDKKTKQVEYYIELFITEIQTGLRFWQKQVQILKRGGTKTPIW